VCKAEPGQGDYQVYIGPSAASEPETQNVVSMLDIHPNIRLFVDVHSYGESILYGWGDDQEQITNPNMNFQNVAFNGQRGIADDAAYREYIDDPDQDFAIDMATRMRDAIRSVRGRTYEVKSSFELYPTAGTSSDYTFSRHLADASNAKVYNYTIEWGSRRNATPFHPPYSEMQNIIREVTAGLLDSCLSIIELTQVSTPSTIE
jgi:carboxypeptidase T